MRRIFLVLLSACLINNLIAQTWSELGSGSNALAANNNITTIVVDHSNNIYAGGTFTDNSGYYMVSKWNGSGWQQLGDMGNLHTKGNMRPISTNCLAIDSADNVYVTYKGETTPDMFLKWNGINWSYIGPTNSLGAFGPLAVDVNQQIYANQYMADVSSEMIYYGIDKRDVSGNWGLLGYIPYENPIPRPPYYSFFMAFNSVPKAIIIDPSGNVYAGGSFYSNLADSVGSNSPELQRVVKYDGAEWSTLESGQEDLGTILDLAADQTGNIYAASNSSTKDYVAVWNGSVWSELGTGINALNANGAIWTLAVDKSGNVYAAGDFKNTDGLQYVAKWDGSRWSEVGAGTGALAANGIIYDVATDAAGNVYAAGDFTNALGKRYVAKWSNDEALGLGSKAAQVVPFYPNPSNGLSQIRVSEDVKLTVYSLLGVPLKTMYVHAGTSSIDLSSLTEGVYTLVCKGDADKNYVPIKFIKE